MSDDCEHAAPAGQPGTAAGAASGTWCRSRSPGSRQKAMASLSGSTREATRPPAKLPRMAVAVKAPSSGQSRCAVLPKRASSAAALLIEMTSREVPTATGISKPSASTRAGTMTKPPPTPKKPVSSPTPVAAATTPAVAGRGGRHRRRPPARLRKCPPALDPWSPPARDRRGQAPRARRPRRLRSPRPADRIAMAPAATSISTANPVSRTAESTRLESRVPTYDPATPSSPKVNPCAKRTRPARRARPSR